jgi:hypothetical protein
VDWTQGGQHRSEKKYCCEIETTENRIVYFTTEYTSVAKSSKKGYDSKTAVLPIIIMIMNCIPL